MKIILTFLILLILVPAFTQAISNKEVPKYLFKIVSQESWQKSQSLPNLILCDNDKDFIHLSTEAQAPKIAEKYWSGKNYIILKIATAKLLGKLVLEANKPGGEEYYHLYNGSIPLSAIEQN
ncbi:MAG TPA: DUF952 domain-containing protein [Candidatus Babeliaceae bacterium]|nr:DUF952 domain-containing protein [Candidatus Babeliaceae bacterium]